MKTTVDRTGKGSIWCTQGFKACFNCKVICQKILPIHTSKLTWRMNHLRSHLELQRLCSSIWSHKLCFTKRVHYLRVVEARHQQHATICILHRHEGCISNTQLGLVVTINISLCANRHVLQTQSRWGAWPTARKLRTCSIGLKIIERITYTLYLNVIGVKTVLASSHIFLFGFTLSLFSVFTTVLIAHLCINIEIRLHIPF